MSKELKISLDFSEFEKLAKYKRLWETLKDSLEDSPYSYGYNVKDIMETMEHE